MNIYGHCPHCNFNLDAGDIAEVFIKQRDDGYTWCAGMTDDEVREHVVETYSEPRRFSHAVYYKAGGRFAGWICPNCKERMDT